MSNLQTPSARLQRLEQILAASRSDLPVVVAGDKDSVTRLLDTLPLERIRRLTGELRQRDDEPNDEIDAVEMRLLLNDYAAAVARLRAVVREAAQVIDAAAAPVQEARKAVRAREKLYASLQEPEASVPERPPRE